MTNVFLKLDRLNHSGFGSPSLLLDGNKTRLVKIRGDGHNGQSVTLLRKNTQYPSDVVPRRLVYFPSWWFINKTITFIQRTVSFKSLFTCQIIKSANREAVPDQMNYLLISPSNVWRVVNN